MPVTREEINELAELRGRIYKHAENELEEIWKHYTPEVAAERFRDFLLQEVPPLINSHADAAGSAVADWYEAIRAKEDVLDKHRYFRAIMGDYPDPQAVNGAIRASARGLFTGKPEQTRQQLATAVRRYIRFTENDTFRKTVLADSAKPRYALVPSLPMTCSWCIMLASRGFVYPKDTAQMMTIHDHCNCTFVPVFKEDLRDAFIDGYDPERYKEMWEKSRQEAARRNRRGKGEHIKQLNVMRELYAGELTDGKWEQLKGKFPGTDITRSQWAKMRQEAAKLAKTQAKDLTLSRNTRNFMLLPPEPKPLPFKWNNEEHFILTDTTWNHILYGDGYSGGHAPGYSWRVTNFSRKNATPHTKTAFPPDWSEKDIATAIRTVIAENRNLVSAESRSITGYYKGVKIKVSLNKPISSNIVKISTAHPID